ncbi:hypothetical protein NKJ81_18110 [Mesorhizobium sp. M0018]|uniref:hypothetical protein n=1 Tax=Mesorhizobium sp. M0018 TaxID=2956844 RepID=UPI00333AEA26
MGQDASNLEGMFPLWEYTFQTNDTQLKRAARSFSDLRYGRSRRWILTGLAWLILIASVLLIIWTSALAVALLEYLSKGVVSSETIYVLTPIAMGTIYIIVARSFFGFFKRKVNNKKIGNITEPVKIFDGYIIQFLDENSIKNRRIERVQLSNDYLFFLIDNGTRFVFIPRDVVPADALEKIKIWATQARS